ncbi:MAG: DNA polymerase IV [Firmicutes bacterium]|nr:DNA polymerase IV [Bacillota bacterium]
MPRLARLRSKTGPEAAAPLAPSEPRRSAAHILHVDMDAFFVSVELLYRPELRGKPVVVGGRPDQRGVVAAASYEARRFGIHSAMPLRTAARLCPQAVFLEGRPQLYVQWSDRMAAILTRYSPVVEMVSIDEAYLDLTGTERLLGPPLAVADRLRREIWSQTGLPCSMGLARTRLVAKVASDQAKPRGLLWVPPGAEAAFLASLPVGKIPGIGRVTEAALARLGIRTVGELAAWPREKLEALFGRWGTALWSRARGEDVFEFLVDAEPKSIGHSHTFGTDVEATEKLEPMLSWLCQKAAKRLRDAGLQARTVTLTIRYVNFHTITRRRTLPEPTDLDSAVFAVARQLLARHRDPRQKIRLIGVSLSGLTHPSPQLPLFDAEHRARLYRLARATDRLRDRFGFDTVQWAGSLNLSEDD